MLRWNAQEQRSELWCCDALMLWSGSSGAAGGMNVGCGSEWPGQGDDITKTQKQASGL
jgi:hypothetical protein